MTCTEATEKILRFLDDFLSGEGPLRGYIPQSQFYLKELIQLSQHFNNCESGLCQWIWSEINGLRLRIPEPQKPTGQREILVGEDGLSPYSY